MNKYIISLHDELFQYYNEYKLNNDINMFIKNIENLLYFYCNIFYLIGINVTRKKLNLKLLNEINNINFLNLKSKEIKQVINNININNYDLIFDEIIKLLIYIYRYYQLIEYKNNNIDEVIVLTNKNSCNICKLLSLQKQNVDDLIKNLDKNHLYCFIQYNIINNIDLSILNEIKNFNSLFTKYNFILINDVDEIMELNKFYLQKEIDIFKDKFISIQCGNNIYINNEYTNINYLLIKYSIKDKLNVDDWWENKFNNTNIFINYKSRKNSYQYLVENVVIYILEPNVLQKIDNENYLKIKNDIMK